MNMYTENFEIEVYAPESGQYAGIQYGWFMRNESADSVVVGLWFYDGKLGDYDELGEDIPKEVLDTLEAAGFNVEDMRPRDNY